MVGAEVIGIPCLRIWGYFMESDRSFLLLLTILTALLDVFLEPNAFFLPFFSVSGSFLIEKH